MPTTMVQRRPASKIGARKKRSAAAKKRIVDLGNVWETEAMRAYKTAAKEAAATAATAPPGAPAVASGDDDWVLVQQTRDPVTLRGDAHEVVLVPEAGSTQRRGPQSRRQAQREADIRRSKGKLPLVTRDMTDTEYNRIFKRPLPHNYGRGNTRPVVDENYMRTFNVKALESGGPDQVYESALAAMAAGPPTSTHLMSVTELQEALDQQQQQQESGSAALAGVEGAAAAAAAAAAAVRAAAAALPTAASAPPAPPAMTFGKPSKDRRLEPSMFEILSWQDPDAHDVEAAPLVGANALDPRNYATLPPTHTQLIPFAGTRKPGSDPAFPASGAAPLL